MLDAAEKLQRATREMTRRKFDADWVLAMGLVKGLEVIGEAAGRLTPELRARYPHVPWKDIVGMRNRLVHGYFDVDMDIVWHALTEEMPQLEAAVRELIDKATSFL